MSHGDQSRARRRVEGTAEAHVLNLRGNFVGSCPRTIARRLLGNGQASLEDLDPFTIRLRCGVGAYLQEFAPKQHPPRPPRDPSLGPTLREHLKTGRREPEELPAVPILKLNIQDFYGDFWGACTRSVAERFLASQDAPVASIGPIVIMMLHEVSAETLALFRQVEASVAQAPSEDLQTERKQPRPIQKSDARQSTSLAESDLPNIVSHLNSGQSMDRVASLFSTSTETLRRYLKERGAPAYTKDYRSI